MIIKFIGWLTGWTVVHRDYKRLHTEYTKLLRTHGELLDEHIKIVKDNLIMVKVIKKYGLYVPEFDKSGKDKKPKAIHLRVIK